jgi:hypothetical protein
MNGHITRTAMIEAESPGGKFVQHMRRYMDVYGWTERDGAVRSATLLAIGSGMKFDENDFKNGNTCASHEDMYRTAVQAQNMTACRALEAVTGIGPYFANDVDLGDMARFVALHLIGKRQRERLCLGASVMIDGRRWFVTALTAEKVRLAAYPTGWQQGKPDKLKALDAEGLAKMFPAPKRAKKEEVAE